MRRPELTSPFAAGLPAGRFIARRSPQFAAAATRRTENKPSGPYLPYEGELYGATTSTTSPKELSFYIPYRNESGFSDEFFKKTRFLFLEDQ